MHSEVVVGVIDYIEVRVVISVKYVSCKSKDLDLLRVLATPVVTWFCCSQQNPAQFERGRVIFTLIWSV